MRWNRRRPLVAVVVLLVMASSCRYELAHPGTTASCGPLEFAVNEHDEAIGASTREAVVDAVAEFGALVGRSVVFAGATETTASGHELGDPLLIEWAWPEEVTDHLGYAEPLVVDGRYREGWIRLRPLLAGAPAGVVRRLVLHELGHLYGLADVDDAGQLMDPGLTVDGWGAGDLVGLLITHDGGCAGNTFADALAALTG